MNLLQSVFQFEHFRPGQREVIERLLAGDSALAIFPTGAGKSLCYQLPALVFEGLTLVVSPLIALMKDQIDALAARGVAAARLDSTLEGEAVREVYSELRSGRLKLLYVAPERFNNERFLSILRGLPLALMAVDEAHCISEWGHNFRPDYLKLAAKARELAVPRVLALTATATPQVAQSIAAGFNIPPEGIVRTGFYRPNLHLYMQPGLAADRDERLLASLRSHPPGPTIVYVTLQRTAEQVAERLATAGFPAEPYHAGLAPEQRSAVQDRFMASDRAIVVATIAFGMGIDKRDIRYVYHYNLPKTLENYAQEIGRAGRDEGVSACFVLAAPEDRIALENFTFGDTPTREALHGLLSELAGAPEVFDLSTYELSARYDIRGLVLETVLTYLELGGLLKSTGPFYTEYRFRWKADPGDVLSRFDPARREFLEKLFSLAETKRVWSAIDVPRASETLGEPRDRILRAVGYFEEKGWLEVQVAGLRHGYRRLAPFSVDEQVSAMARRFEQREQGDLERLDRMVALAQHPGCTTAALLEYFGEAMEPCGHCGSCQGQPPGQLRPAVPRAFSEPAGPDHPALAHPRQRARFLCGLPSPMASRARLSGHPAFGSLADVPFREVLRLCEGARSP